MNIQTQGRLLLSLTILTGLISCNDSMVPAAPSKLSTQKYLVPLFKLAVSGIPLSQINPPYRLSNTDSVTVSLQAENLNEFAVACTTIGDKPVGIDVFVGASALPKPESEYDKELTSITLPPMINTEIERARLDEWFPLGVPDGVVVVKSKETLYCGETTHSVISANIILENQSQNVSPVWYEMYFSTPRDESEAEFRIYEDEIAQLYTDPPIIIELFNREITDMTCTLPSGASGPSINLYDESGFVAGYDDSGVGIQVTQEVSVSPGVTTAVTSGKMTWPIFKNRDYFSLHEGTYLVELKPNMACESQPVRTVVESFSVASSGNGCINKEAIVSEAEKCDLGRLNHFPEQSR